MHTENVKKLLNWEPKDVHDLHSVRLQMYFKSTKLDQNEALERLILIHRQGINMAEHMSKTIGMNHEWYIKMLTQFNEPSMFIR